MNVWEFLGENDISKIRFRQPDDFSPYCEWEREEFFLQNKEMGANQKPTEDVLDVLKETKNIKNLEIQYHCLYRYEEIFEALLCTELSEPVKAYDTLKRRTMERHKVSDNVFV